MSEIKEIKKIPVFDLPPACEQVLLVESETNRGWYEVEFKTSAGWMKLARKSDYKRAFEYKSINSAVDKLRQLGWCSSIIISEQRF